MISLEIMKAVSTLADFFDSVDISSMEDVSDACTVGVHLNKVLQVFSENVVEPTLKKYQDTPNFDWNSLLNKPKNDED